MGVDQRQRTATSSFPATCGAAWRRMATHGAAWRRMATHGDTRRRVPTTEPLVVVVVGKWRRNTAPAKMVA